MRIKRFKVFVGAAVVIILAASVLLGISGCGESGLNVMTMKDKENGSEEQGNTEEVTTKVTTEEVKIETTTDATENKSTICVYICGAVVNEGVYELPAGSRVSDALEKAGGYSENALHGYVNLAKVVEDGERVYIPDQQELESLGILEGDNSSSSSGDSSGAGSSGGSNGGSDNSLVNINTADSETLQTLPGIGEKKAANIIAYREEHGAFSAAEDLKNVSGIGDSTYEKLSPHITVN